MNTKIDDSEEREDGRQRADRLQAEHLAKGNHFTDWFERLYAGADGDPAMVPWADLVPHPGLVEWMDSQPDGEGKKAVDVGCGLGDNAIFLATNGYQVTAMDLSPTAVAWAVKRNREKNISFLIANLFELPPIIKGSFDLVHETYTLQSLPAEIRRGAMQGVASLVKEGGTLLVICRARDEDVTPEGPPWPLAKSELDHFLELGLELVQIDKFDEEKSDGRTIPHWRAEYKKPC